MLKKTKLRYNEYYDMQRVYDSLYSASKNGNNFYKLLEIIGSEENIRLAYRNLKSNKGSNTKGTDGKTIDDIKELTDETVINTVREMLADYKPKSVRRVYIPKPGSDKKRPLGIPCIWDRLVQQCILQVLEPICEPKFHNHSYGFRPNRDTHHAISRTVSMINMYKETKEMLDDLTTRDQRMMFGILTMVHMADSKKQLDSDTESILSVARKHLCQMATLKWQQVDGLNTVLPYGIRKINALRTLTTESTAVLIPFHTQEIMQPGGIYYGQNAVSKNMLVADRRKLLNGNSFRLGVSGSGKSFSAKEEIVDLALSTEDDILILDPESEFGSLVEALNGEVISISAMSHTHLNALDMDSAYGNDKNPLIEKSEFILSLFEQLVGAGNLSAKEKSILDRCTADVYREYIRSGYQSEVPTLKDLYRQLMLQPEEEARGLALSSELFINGSLNTFAQKTNVDTKNRIIAYDIRELGEQLMPLGMLVTLDSIFNRVIQNWKKGKTTWIFADEFYLLFRYQYSADFFYRLYKRIRKYQGFVTGLTQNVEELLKSDTARLMLANSEFLILLNQATTDRDELASLLNISENQLSYITNVGAGKGLIRCSGNLVPFENSFPKNTKLYRLMTTKPGEC